MAITQDVALIEGDHSVTVNQKNLFVCLVPVTITGCSFSLFTGVICCKVFDIRPRLISLYDMNIVRLHRYIQTFAVNSK